MKLEDWIDIVMWVILWPIVIGSIVWVCVGVH
jgi:hypothetical protein